MTTAIKEKLKINYYGNSVHVVKAQIPLGSSRLDMTRSTCRVRRDERVVPCSSTSSTQPKCMGSTRRTNCVCRDVTWQAKWN